MESKARDILVAAVGRAGSAIITDPRRCQALLRDEFQNRHSRELAVLLTALLEGVAKELAEARSSVDDHQLSRLAQRLHDQQGLELAAARWSVESWALAFGATRQDKLLFEVACAACNHRFKLATWHIGKPFKCPRCNAGLAISADRQRIWQVADDGVTPLRPLASPVTSPPPRPAPAPIPSPALPPQPATRNGAAKGWLLLAALIGGALLLSLLGTKESGPPAATLPSRSKADPPPWMSARTTSAAPPVVSAPLPTVAPAAIAAALAASLAAAAASPESPPVPAPVPATAPEPGLPVDPAKVAKANEASILRVLDAARDGDPAKVDESARAAARDAELERSKASWSPNVPAVIEAKRLNEEALAQLRSAGGELTPELARSLLPNQSRAFRTNPFDIEVSSNFAMYLLRAGETDAAYTMVLYTMSLPRSPQLAQGRTADWNTLAATFAARGDEARARETLWVTLALTSNVEKRCSVAVDVTRRTYGPRLRGATEAMLERVRDRRLSEAAECALPINW